MKNTQKITKAMKLVSAAKLRRSQERAHASRPYEEELISIVSGVLDDISWTSPLLESREGGKTAFIVISTDRGLCGSLNSNNLKQALKRAFEFRREEIEIIALGKKGADFFKKRGFEVSAVHLDMARKGTFENIEKISLEIQELFLAKKVNRVEIFYSRFESALIQKPTQFLWLPFELPSRQEKKTFLCEPEGQRLLRRLVPELLTFRLYRAVLESVASEFGARMNAMESATKNAKEVIEKLTLERNRARQAAITKELMEIIGGAEALSA